MIIRPLSLIALFALTVPLLAGCQTIQGIQKDFTRLGNSINNKIAATTADQAPATVLAQDGNCPPIIIDPQLDTLAEFSNMENPKPSEEISRAALTGTQNECIVEGDHLNMRIDLAFVSELGPKARRKKDDRPFFAYPYFVSVTDSAGTELAREVFAASITYDNKQSSISLVETIRQKLPLSADGSLPDYQVQIGFQLTEEQLFYNASL